MIELKEADLLRAIADGKQMQRKDWDGWVDCTRAAALVRISMGMPTRVKPEPKPDIVRFMPCATHFGFKTFEEAKRIARSYESSWVIKVVIDGETGAGKSTEVVV